MFKPKPEPDFTMYLTVTIDPNEPRGILDFNFKYTDDYKLHLIDVKIAYIDIAFDDVRSSMSVAITDTCDSCFGIGSSIPIEFGLLKKNQDRIEPVYSIKETVYSSNLVSKLELLKEQTEIALGIRDKEDNCRCSIV